MFKSRHDNIAAQCRTWSETIGKRWIERNEKETEQRIYDLIISKIKKSSKIGSIRCFSENIMGRDRASRIADKLTNDGFKVFIREAGGSVCGLMYLEIEW